LVQGGLILLIDLLSKSFISRALPLGRSLDLLDGILRITSIRNKGAIFGLSLGDSTGSILLLVSSLAVTFIIISYFRLPLGSTWYGRGLVLILSGALGNLFDRLTLGEVRDFIDIGVGDMRWPVFNVADLAVTAGAILLAMEFLGQSKKKEASHERGEGGPGS
jgi:signal peptidase II